MSLLRTNIKSLVKINTIIFDNFVKLKADISIPYNKYITDSNTINFDKLMELKLKCK